MTGKNGVGVGRIWRLLQRGAAVSQDVRVATVEAEAMSQQRCHEWKNGAGEDGVKRHIPLTSRSVASGTNAVEASANVAQSASASKGRGRLQDWLIPKSTVSGRCGAPLADERDDVNGSEGCERLASPIVPSVTNAVEASVNAEEYQVNTGSACCDGRSWGCILTDARIVHLQRTDRSTREWKDDASDSGLQCFLLLNGHRLACLQGLQGVGVDDEEHNDGWHDCLLMMGAGSLFTALMHESHPVPGSRCQQERWLSKGIANGSVVKHEWKSDGGNNGLKGCVWRAIL
ncbi:uncharacterized protein EMH_0064770 [Eimeria mitis]|uniref:Uncharacterized protein n=1 Tax=Eimeria mitis TaxID=44415 RepID=U6K4D0_9EIME|nr:uncharacterized protein EMH_0064770 [Eimeria mitis]CDJ31192.1 hypothetical protein EMH_0064770 [Eimeria mitis]